jgi:hypothetical protein
MKTSFHHLAALSVYGAELLSFWAFLLDNSAADHALASIEHR